MRKLRETRAQVQGAGSDRTIAAVSVALFVGIIALYSYQTGMWNSPLKNELTPDRLRSLGPLPKFVQNPPQERPTASSPYSEYQLR